MGSVAESFGEDRWVVFIPQQRAADSGSEP